MTVEVHGRRRFQRYEQFDPLTSSELSLFHVECAGGLISCKIDTALGIEFVHLTCTACGAKEVVPGDLARASV